MKETCVTIWTPFPLKIYRDYAKFRVCTFLSSISWARRMRTTKWKTSRRKGKSREVSRRHTLPHHVTDLGNIESVHTITNKDSTVNSSNDFSHAMLSADLFEVVMYYSETRNFT